MRGSPSKAEEMMNYFEELGHRRYGALQLSKEVGHNMLIGLLVSLLAHAAIISSPYLIAVFKGERVSPIAPIVIHRSDIFKLPIFHGAPPALKFQAPSVAPTKMVLPVPVPMEPTEAPFLPPTQVEWKKFLGGNQDTGLLNGLARGEVIPIDDPLQTSDTSAPTGFVPLEEYPQVLDGFSPSPAYPEIAKTAGVKGYVNVKVLVLRDGTVGKFEVLQAKPAGLGFEDEVAKVIVNWRFTPAIQNGKTIPVWVEIPFEFSLDK